jgi:hypothetical protein
MHRLGVYGSPCRALYLVCSENDPWNWFSDTNHAHEHVVPLPMTARTRIAKCTWEFACRPQRAA